MAWPFLPCVLSPVRPSDCTTDEARENSILAEFISGHSFLSVENKQVEADPGQAFSSVVRQNSGQSIQYCIQGKG